MQIKNGIFYKKTFIVFIWKIDVCFWITSWFCNCITSMWNKKQRQNIEQLIICNWSIRFFCLNSQFSSFSRHFCFVKISKNPFIKKNLEKMQKFGILFFFLFVCDFVVVCLRFLRDAFVCDLWKHFSWNFWISFCAFISFDVFNHMSFNGK